jgi:hypothetical protein
MPRRTPRRSRRNTRRRRPNGSGPSQTPSVALTRKFRYIVNMQLNNTTGTGLDQYAYVSKYMFPEPEKVTGFKDCQQTFEFWRMKRLRVKAICGYNSYNQTYNTINLDAVAAMQIWTVSDWSTNESVSGVSIMSYNNAKVNTLSFNGFTKLVDTAVRINDETVTPSTILPASTWLDTAKDMSSSRYSGFQLFARMPGVSATNYLPEIQLVVECECQFKQPAYQNRPNTFESNFGSQLVCQTDSSDPTVLTSYTVDSYTMKDGDNIIRLVKSDGTPGSLDYTQHQFFTLYVTNKSGPYFGNRPCVYTGPVPRKPADWTPPLEAD